MASVVHVRAERRRWSRQDRINTLRRREIWNGERSSLHWPLMNPLRAAASMCLLALLSACLAGIQDEVRDRQTEGLRTVIVKALSDRRPELREAALWALTTYGDRSDLRYFRALVIDKEIGVKREALRGFVAYGTEADVELLLKTYYNSEASLRPVVLAALEKAGPSDAAAAAIRRILSTERDPSMRARALRVLCKASDEDIAPFVDSFDVESLSASDLMQLSFCLDNLKLSSAEVLLRRLLAHGLPDVRHRASSAMQRIPELETDPVAARCIISGYTDRFAYGAEANRAIITALEERSSIVDYANFIGALRGFQVVLLGETHGNTKTQEFQMRLLHSLRQASAGRTICLGYEETVRDIQAPVVDYAETLGYETASLEGDHSNDPEWPYKLRLRDELAAGAAAGWLVKDASTPRCLVILYGEAHVCGGGHLGDLVGARKCVVLTGYSWPGLIEHLSVSGEAVIANIGHSRDVFLVSPNRWWEGHHFGQTLIDYVREQKLLETK